MSTSKMKVQDDIRCRHTLLASLRACAETKDVVKGCSIHARIAQTGMLKKFLSVANGLINMYAKCGLLARAQQVFDKLPDRDIVSWNALITGYAQHGRGDEALKWFECMQSQGVSANAITYLCCLKACGSIGAVHKGEKIHAEIERSGLLEKDILVGTTLVDMYAKCGFLSKAQEVFDKLPVRNVVTWSVLIAGYTQHGYAKQALNCFEQMQLKGVFSSAVTFVCILKACGSIGAIDLGRELHDEIERRGLLQTNTIVGNALVDMYAKCGALAKAQEVFNKLPIRDIISWTSLTTGYTQHGCAEAAVSCLGQMQLEGICPNKATFICILKACGSIAATGKGQEIHAEVARNGLLEKDPAVGTALVDMYAKCGMLTKAQGVFDKLAVRDVVTWSALIAGYVQYGWGEEAINCYGRMQLDGVLPNEVTFVCILKACGSLRAVDKGQEIHAEIVKEQLLERELAVGNALVDMYAKCGWLAKAQEVLETLPSRDVYTWSALISGYAQHGCGEEAVNCLGRMQLEGICPNAFTYICSLKACSSMGAVDKGQEVHAEITKAGLLEKDLVVGNALVDMYAKCGLLFKAQEVFDKLPVRDTVSWNALIGGYAQVAQDENAFVTFSKMIGEGMKPDLVTFVSVLNACSHIGLLEKGLMYFVSMSKDYDLEPTCEHYVCILDLLGRAGQLGNAISMLKKMPFHANPVVWHIILGACRKWGNVDLGRYAFEHALQQKEKDFAAYVCMYNIYADAGMQDEADKVEAMRVEKKAWKKSGHS